MITEPFKLYTQSFRNPTSDADGYVSVVGSAEAVETFTDKVLAIILKIHDNDVYVQLSYDGTNYDDKILLEAGDPDIGDDVLAVSYQAKSVKITNVNPSGTADARYQLIGWK